MTNIIHIENVSKRFGNFLALNNFNLDINKGEIYGLLGPNGAGKTTLIKILLNILSKSAGRFTLFGVEGENEKITSKIGYMPQETALYADMTVHENISLFGEVYGLDKNTIKEREAKLLNIVDLSDWRDKVVLKLSGGMKHRASLACSLIHDPDLLFLDEPTVGVDPELRMSFWNYFHALKKEGKTVIITTHYMDEATRCTKVGFIRGGKMISEGTPSDIKKKTGKDNLEDAFLELTKGR